MYSSFKYLAGGDFAGVAAGCVCNITLTHIFTERRFLFKFRKQKSWSDIGGDSGKLAVFDRFLHRNAVLDQISDLVF